MWIAFRDHKRVVVYVPYKVKTIHHKHTVVKNNGGGDNGENVIGFSGSEAFGNLQSILDTTAEKNSFGESYGGGHGQNWLQASKASDESSVGDFGTPNGFGGFGHFGGGGFMGSDSFEGAYGGDRVSLANTYMSGLDEHI